MLITERIKTAGLVSNLQLTSFKVSVNVSLHLYEGTQLPYTEEIFVWDCNQQHHRNV